MRSDMKKWFSLSAGNKPSPLVEIVNVDAKEMKG